MKKIVRNLFKHKYIRVIIFNSDKTSQVKYLYRDRHVVQDQLKFKNRTYLINSNHVFNANGYATVLLNDKASETINPLNFRSKYNEVDFQSAINSKIIKETFESVKTNTIDIVKILLFANIFISIIILYFFLQQSGMIS